MVESRGSAERLVRPSRHICPVILKPGLNAPNEGAAVCWLRYESPVDAYGTLPRRAVPVILSPELAAPLPDNPRTLPVRLPKPFRRQVPDLMCHQIREHHVHLLSVLPTI